MSDLNKPTPVTDEEKSKAAETASKVDPTKPDLTAPVKDIPAPAQAMTALTALKKRADVMGVSYPNNIGEDALRKKLEDHLNPSNDEEKVDSTDTPEGEKSEAQKNAEFRAEIRKEQTRLVRVRITCMNPAKADIPGEIFTVTNKFLGTIRRMIPFGEQTDNGWHVELCLLNQLKNRKFQQITTKTGKNGQRIPSSRWVPEFSIEELEPLTPEELRVLANKQAAAKGEMID